MNTKKTIHLIAAARPNFMKIAPLYHALAREDWAEPVIIHTGQHYDLNMSDVFFKDLGLPRPHLNLGIGSGTHAGQTGGVMIAYEKVLIKKAPDLTVVVGDVNSTVACSLAASKLGVPVAHLEAGLRSFDRTMPEEINRVVTDAISDFLWTPSPDADENLGREGIPASKIERVGNIMIDSLVMMTPAIQHENTVSKLKLDGRPYGVVTIHRPANVDKSQKLEKIVEALVELSEIMPLIFTVHPRTKKQLIKFGFLHVLEQVPSVILQDPLSYKSFMNLIFNGRIVVTDSGGIQEETTFLGIPCLTLRPNTERPVTITQGTNRLTDIKNLKENFMEATAHSKRQEPSIEFWDGRTADRIVRSLKKILKGF